ncbi:MAG TPA: GNAT family N-acetyltransferase [Rhizomicrobium sp.]|nr:GNAT family N-acetyltransferase [Rhizomicrobium sp.]
MSDVSIRRVEQGDLPALLDIYNHYVVHTPITFDIEPRTLAQRQQWLDQFKPTGRFQCFVAVRGNTPLGWASSVRFKDRAAYDTSVESGIYLAPDETGRGLGRRLYGTLLEALAGEDIHRAFGGVTQPNEASCGLHLAMGFRHVGTYREVGRKFGRFWDVAWYERPVS